MEDKMKNEILVRLYDKFDTEQLKEIATAFEIASCNYDIKARCTELAIYEPGVEEIRTYAVIRSIEGLSKKTIGGYILILTNFYKYVSKPTNQITTNDIRMYLHIYKRDRNISNRTLETHRVVINTFLAWAACEGYCTINACATIKPIKFQKNKKKPLTQFELEKIRNSCTTIREHAIIEMLYSTGCRVTELERLNIEDVNFDTKEVKLFGKGDKHRVSYINAKAEYWLNKYLESRTDDNESLFVYERRPFARLKKDGIERQIKVIENKANVSCHFTPHIFRHTLATHAVQRGCKVEEVAQILGHSKLDTTLIYTNISNNEVKRKHNLCII